MERGCNFRWSDIGTKILKWSGREPRRCLGKHIPGRRNSQGEGCQAGARRLCSRNTQKASELEQREGEWGWGGGAVRPKRRGAQIL